MHTFKKVSGSYKDAVEIEGRCGRFCLHGWVVMVGGKVKVVDGHPMYFDRRASAQQTAEYFNNLESDQGE